ncbi:MAG: DMT family protein [Betaproteobacteria bacterium]|nr:DMT family protein [Betaproteobacteria bacterium]
MQFLQSLPLSLQSILLLVASNVFMTFAWYGHLKNLATAPWYVAAFVSWGIALAEYLLQVPANRIGYQQAGFSVGQLKILQEVITLGVFVPFALIYMEEPLKLDYLWAALCLVGAVYFVFRSA